MVEHRAGTGWVAERLAALVERHSPTAVVIDPGSAAGALLPAIEAAGIDVTKTDRPGRGRRRRHVLRRHPAGRGHAFATWDRSQLTAAVAGAVQRPLADAWSWSRRGSTVCITPLVACSLALWGHSRAPGLQLFVRAG